MNWDARWLRFLTREPILARELREALRTGKTLFLMIVLAVLLGLLILGIGSAFGMTRAPVNFGAVLFQIFFSLAFFVVTIVGPALAAVGISSEKDRRTWESLLLTRLGIRAIARGKFWAAVCAVLAFVVMITPASLLSLLLGGVTVTEVAIAFVLLALISLVAVGFGTSTGAAAQGVGSATLVTMAFAMIASPVLYLAVGVGMSFFAHATWPEVPSFSPVWLPLAYTRGKFDVWYVVLLFVVPATVVPLALWFLYELTIVRLSSESDDRATGLKRWYVVSLPVVTAIATIPGFMTRGPSRLAAWVGGMGGLFVFVAFSAFVFVGDTLTASRRVDHRWRKEGARWGARLLGPGLVQTSTFVMVTSVFALAFFAVLGAAVLAQNAPAGAPPAAAIALLSTCEYWSAFLVFLVGFLLWTRVRADSASGARLLTAMVGAVALAAPWVLYLAFGYAAARHVRDTIVLAAPSPLYSFVVMGAIDRGEPHIALTTSLACSFGWVAMGLALFGLGARRATRIVAERRTERANLDARIAHENRPRVLGPRDTAAPTEA